MGPLFDLCYIALFHYFFCCILNPNLLVFQNEIISNNLGYWRISFCQVCVCVSNRNVEDGKDVKELNSLGDCPCTGLSGCRQLGNCPKWQTSTPQLFLPLFLLPLPFPSPVSLRSLLSFHLFCISSRHSTVPLSE